MRGRLLHLPARPWIGCALLVLLAAIGIANWRIDALPPEPVPADAPDSRFSADRAWETVEAMAVQPHPIGTPENERVRDLLVERLDSLGFDVEVQSELARNTSDGTSQFGVVENLVATLPGTDPTGTVLLTSHYDSVPSGPGAADAASGVAALIESARALSVEGPHRNDLVVLLTDGEEMGLLGAEAYTRSHPAGQSPTVAFNLEARGVSGSSTMFETSLDNAALIELFAESAPHPYGDSSAIEAYRHMPNDTDFTRFQEAEYTGLNNAFIGGPSWYHSPYDDTDHLDPASLQHHGANTLGTARELVGTDLTQLEADGDRTFFGFLGLLVHYDEGWNLPVALLGAAAAIGAAALARARHALSLPRLGLAAVSFAAPVAVAAVAAVALWPGLQALRPGYADTSGLLFEHSWYYLAILAFALAALTAWYTLVRGRLGAAAASLAPLMWLAAAGVVTAVALPGVSFAFAVPALAALALLIAMLAEPRRRWMRLTGYGLFAIALVPAVVQLSWTANLLEAFGMDLAAVPAALIVMYAAPALPLLAMWRRFDGRGGALVPTAAAVAALALVGTGLVVDRFDADHPRQAYLSYVFDADTGTAAWVSADQDRSDWTAGYVTEDGLDGSQLPAAYTDAAENGIGHGAAEPIGAPAPEAVYQSRSNDSASLHLSSPRGAETMWLAAYGEPERVEIELADGSVLDAEVEPPASDGDPSLIWVYGVPDDGVSVTLHGPADRFEITVFDQTHGLQEVGGFTERPEGLMRSVDRMSDTVTVAAAATGP